MHKRIEERRGEQEDPDKLIKGAEDTLELSQSATLVLPLTDGPGDEDARSAFRRPGCDDHLELPLPARSFSRGRFVAPTGLCAAALPKSDALLVFPTPAGGGDKGGVGRVALSCPTSP